MDDVESYPLPCSTDYRKLYNTPNDTMISRFMTMTNPYTYIMEKLYDEERITVTAIEKGTETDITSDLTFKIALSRMPACAIAIDVVHAKNFGNGDFPFEKNIIQRIEDTIVFNKKPDLETLKTTKFQKKVLLAGNAMEQKISKNFFLSDTLEGSGTEIERKYPLPVYIIERTMSIREKEEFDRKLIQYHVDNSSDFRRRPIEFHGSSGSQGFGEMVHSFASLVKRVHCNSCFARMNLAMFHLDDALNCPGCYADDVSASNKPYIVPLGRNNRYAMTEQPGYVSACKSSNSDTKKKYSHSNLPIIPNHIKEAMRKERKGLELSNSNQFRYTMDTSMVLAAMPFGEPLVEDLLNKSQIDIPPVEHLVPSSASHLYGEPLMEEESRSWVTTDVSKFDSSDPLDSFNNYKENVVDNDNIQYQFKRQSLLNVKKELLCDSTNDYAENGINCFQVPQSGPIPFIVEEALIDSSAEALKFLRVDPDPIPSPHFLKWEKLPQMYTVRNKNGEPCGRITASTLGDPKYKHNTETVNGKVRGTIHFAISYEIDSSYVYETSHLGRTDIPADVMQAVRNCEKEEPTMSNRKREMPYTPELEVRRLRLSSPTEDESAPKELPTSLMFGQEQPKKKKFSLKSKTKGIFKPFHSMFNLKR